MQVYLKRAVILFETFGNKDARTPRGSFFKNIQAPGTQFWSSALLLVITQSLQHQHSAICIE